MQSVLDNILDVIINIIIIVQCTVSKLLVINSVESKSVSRRPGFLFYTLDEAP